MNTAERKALELAVRRQMQAATETIVAALLEWARAGRQQTATVFRTEVGAIVWTTMKTHGKTRAEVAARLGCSVSSVSRRLNGRVPFDLDQLEDICRWLDIPVVAVLPRLKMVAE
jgi:antitoxin component HigA of HigAB toxin-antitoxin module